MNNSMNYKGYTAVIGYEEGDEVLFGKVIGIRDEITFEGTCVKELQEAFKEAVDDYLSYCEEEGIEPSKPYSGNFIVRIPSELHREISELSELEGISLNKWAIDAFEKKLFLEKKSV